MSKQVESQLVAKAENPKTTGVLQRVRSKEQGEDFQEAESPVYKSRFQANMATVPVRKAPNKTGLPDNLKAGVEALSGFSMDDVRVHYNSSKPTQLQALAYTQGTEIHVGPGQEKHLAHEAWHVIQQMQGRVKPTMQRKGVRINDNEGLETEADFMGSKAKEYQHQDTILYPSRSAEISLHTIQRATVVRGGTCKAEQFVKGAEKMEADGKLYGVSTSSNLAKEGDLDILGNTVFNKKIGVSTTEKIEQVGGTCTSTPTKNNPWHTDLDGLTGNEAETVFTIMVNPNPKQKS